MKKNKSIYVMARIGVLGALYVVLSLFSIRAGNLRFTLSSLPVTVSAMLCGPFEAMLTALVGEFINQIRLYGLSQTTAMWLIPPILRACVIGCSSKYFLKKQKPIERMPAIALITCVAAALLTTAANTLVIYIDSKIWGYYTKAYVLGDLAVRIITGVITAVIVCIAACEVTRLIKKAGVLR